MSACCTMNSKKILEDNLNLIFNYQWINIYEMLKTTTQSPTIFCLKNIYILCLTVLIDIYLVPDFGDTKVGPAMPSLARPRQY